MRRERLESAPSALLAVQPGELRAAAGTKSFRCCDEVISHADLQRNSREEIEKVGAQSLARPLDRQGGERTEPLHSNRAGDGAVVISADAKRITLSNKGDATRGVRVVPDRVAEQHRTVHVLPGDRLQGGSQRIAHRSQGIRGMPVCLAARRSPIMRHQHVPARAGPATGRGNPAKSA